MDIIQDSNHITMSQTNEAKSFFFFLYMCVYIPLSIKYKVKHKTINKKQSELS